MKDIDSKANPPIILAAAIGGFAVIGSIGRYRAHRFKHKVLTAADKVRTGDERNPAIAVSGYRQSVIQPGRPNPAQSARFNA